MKNKYLFLAILIFFVSKIAISQTKFTEGFNNGYKKGYCQDQGVGCIEPIPPIAPIPNANEYSSNYQHGYNRGFKMGLSAQKSSLNSNTDNRQRYKTSTAKYIDKMDTVDYSSAIQLALVLRESKGTALEYYRNGEYQASLDIALKGLSIKNDDEEFMILAGQALLRLNRYSEALPHLKRAYSITKDPNIKKAINDIENGKLEEKKEVKKEVDEIQNNPDKNFEPFITTFDNPPFEMSLYSKPSVNSEIRYKCPKDSQVKVLGSSGEIFFKVIVDGYSGYVTKKWLKRQW